MAKSLLPASFPARELGSGPFHSQIGRLGLGGVNRARPDRMPGRPTKILISASRCPISGDASVELLRLVWVVSCLIRYMVNFLHVCGLCENLLKMRCLLQTALPYIQVQSAEILRLTAENLICTKEL